MLVPVKMQDEMNLVQIMSAIQNEWHRVYLECSIAKAGITSVVGQKLPAKIHWGVRE